MLFLLVLPVTFVFVLVLKKVLMWLDDRGYIFYTGNPQTYGTLGRGLMEIQAMLQPGYEHVLEQKEHDDLRRDHGAASAGHPRPPAPGMTRPARHASYSSGASPVSSARFSNLV